ncbi:MAG TPA: glutaminase A [Pseudomonadales bacterium]|nr:glutaminase A [Pseudomonadales bacterium]
MNSRDSHPPQDPSGSAAAVGAGVAPQALAAAVEEALEAGRAAALRGTPASYIPELARADPAWVAVAVSTLDGHEVVAGDAGVRFTLQSVSKVFSLACLLRAGDATLWDRVQMEPSGDAFHSIVRLEEEKGRPRNPFINAGAIVVSSRLPGGDAAGRIAHLRRFLQDAAGSGSAAFELDAAVYESECRTGFRNRALANYMKHFGVIDDPFDAADGYFRQCALTANIAELARVGLFLANAGQDPITRNRLLAARDNRMIVALMSTCGLYDEVGRFAVRVGIPAKSGVSGGVLGIVPGRMAIACYGPALGPVGNSLAGMTMLEVIVDRLGLSVFEAR